jgi:hypothetical protein
MNILWFCILSWFIPLYSQRNLRRKEDSVVEPTYTDDASYRMLPDGFGLKYDYEITQENFQKYHSMAVTHIIHSIKNDLLAFLNNWANVGGTIANRLTNYKQNFATNLPATNNEILRELKPKLDYIQTVKYIHRRLNTNGNGAYSLDTHFDYNNYPHLLYMDNDELAAHLAVKTRNCLDNLKQNEILGNGFLVGNHIFWPTPDTRYVFPDLHGTANYCLNLFYHRFLPIIPVTAYEDKSENWWRINWALMQDTDEIQHIKFKIQKNLKRQQLEIMFYVKEAKRQGLAPTPYSLPSALIDAFVLGPKEKVNKKNQDMEPQVDIFSFLWLGIKKE